MKINFLQKTQKTALKQIFKSLFLLDFWVIGKQAVLSGHNESMVIFC
jgi:hypothetical protein